MGSLFRFISNEKLLELWEHRRDAVLAKGEGGATRADVEELGMIRRELDRRHGLGNPGTEVDFEKYVSK